MQAEVAAAGDNPRFVDVSSATLPARVKPCTAPAALRKRYQGGWNDLHSDRTSATTFLANATRLGVGVGPMSCIMRSAPRSLTRPWPRPNPPPDPYALQSGHAVKQYKDRILVHLPTSCPVKALLHRVTTLLPSSLSPP